MRWDYPAIEGVQADLLLVTHEHLDHNGVGAIGEVLAVAAEHDDAAGTERGPNTLFAFTLGGRRVAQRGLAEVAEVGDAQARALGTVDVLFVPVGGSATIGADQAADVAARLGAPIVVPMHYRTERIDFLEPVDDFAQRAARVERLRASAFELDDLPHGDGPLVVVPAAP